MGKNDNGYQNMVNDAGTYLEEYNQAVFSHHIESYNDFFSSAPLSRYNLKNLCGRFCEILNEAVSKKTGKPELFNISVGDINFSADKTIKNNSSEAIVNFNGTFNSLNYPTTQFIHFPLLNKYDGCFLSRNNNEDGSAENYYTPVIRLLRRAAIKFKDFRESHSDENNDDKIKTKNRDNTTNLFFDIIPERGFFVSLKVSLNNSNGTVNLYARLNSEILESRVNPKELESDGVIKILNNDPHDTSKYIEISDKDFEKSDIYKIINGQKPVIKLKNGVEQTINFNLSKHLRDIINKTFGTSSDSDFIEMPDLLAIKKAFSSDKPETKQADKVKEITLKMNNFIEYLDNHLIGLLSSYEACLINEAIYSYCVSWFKKVIDKFAEKMAKNIISKKKTDLTNQLCSIFEFISEKLMMIHEIPGIELLDMTNPSARTAHQRKVTFLSDVERSPRSFSAEAAQYLPKPIRDVNCSVIGRICPVETPESEKIGLINFLASGASIDLKNGEILSETASGKVAYETEERAFLKQSKENYYSLIFNGSKSFNSLEFEKNFMEWKKSPECLYSVDAVNALGYSALLIPFINHNDAARSLMGAKNLKSAVPLLKPELPIIKTGFETNAFAAGYKNPETGVIKSPCEGILKGISTGRQNGRNILMFMIEDKENNLHKVTVEKYKISPTHTFSGFVPMVSYEPDFWKGVKGAEHLSRSRKTICRVSKGQPLAIAASCSEAGEIMSCPGVNLLTVFAIHEGYNFEDGIVISQKLVDEDILTSISLCVLKNSYDPDIFETEVMFKEAVAKLLFQEISKDTVVDLYNVKVVEGVVEPKKKEVTNRRTSTDYELETYYGTVIDVSLVKEKTVTGKNRDTIKITFAQKKKIGVGDKLMGRYGNKGVVSKILPIDKMPKLKDGTPVDIILNPNSAIGRMNIGQIIETQISPLKKYGVIDKNKDYRPFDNSNEAYKLLGSAENFKKFVKQRVIDSKTKEALELKKTFDYDETLKVTLYKNSPGGASFEKYYDNPVLAGYQYIFKLNHISEDKIHSRGDDEAYDIKYQQPVKGKKRCGGQKIGEMEVWALLAFGANNTLKHVISDISQKKVEIKDAASKNAVETFEIESSVTNTLRAWLAAMGIYISRADENRDGELEYSVNLLNNSNFRNIFPGSDLRINGFKASDAYKMIIDNPKYIEEQKSFSPSDELTNIEYYGNISKFSKLGVDLYKNYGIIRFEEPIINPILADGLLKHISKSIKQTCVNDKKEMSKYSALIDSIQRLLSPKSPANFNIDENIVCGSVKALKDLIVSNKTLLGSVCDEIISVVEHCKMNFILIPPLIARAEPAIIDKMRELESTMNYNKESDKIKKYLESKLELKKDSSELKKLTALLSEHFNGAVKFKKALDEIKDIIEPVLKKSDDKIKDEILKYIKSKYPKSLKEKFESSNVRLKDFVNKMYEKIFYIVSNKNDKKDKMRADLFSAVYWLFFNDGKNEKGILARLATKEGLLRKNILGRRIDYSGRAVIVPEPGLKLGEVVLSYNFAYKFLKNDPEFKNLISRHKHSNYIDKFNAISTEHMVKERYIIFNRQPTLHRFAMQAFKIKHFCLEDVIKIHPLSCEGLGADFDGDTSALYYMGSKELQQEAKEKLSIANNLVKSTAADNIMLHYEQDFNLGEYIMFPDKYDENKGESKAAAYIKNIIDTLPDKLKNHFEKAGPCDKISSFISSLLKYSVKIYFESDDENTFNAALAAIDKIKLDTLSRATRFGASFGVYDLCDMHGDYENENEFKAYVKNVNESNGLKLFLKSESKGNYDIIRQLCGSAGRGKMQTLRGNLHPATDAEIKSCLLEGHDLYEYITSIHGARCGLGMKKLLTPACGYFTRMLVETLYDVKVVEKDCKTKNCIEYDVDYIKTLFTKDNKVNYDDLNKALKHILLYRYDSSGKLISDEVFNNNIKFDKDGKSKAGKFIMVRSPLLCECKNGICSKCHGLDFTRNIEVPVGYNAGINAAQAIGERGTQLAMKMFHGGGIYKNKFVNAVEKLQKDIKSVKNLGVKDAYFKIFKEVIQDHIFKNKVSAVNFELLVSALADTEKGDKIIKYNHSNAGSRIERDFLSRISYGKLVSEVSNEAWQIAAGGLKPKKYATSSEKARIIFSKLIQAVK